MWVKQCHKPPMWEGYTTPFYSNNIQHYPTMHILGFSQPYPGHATPLAVKEGEPALAKASRNPPGLG